MYTTPECEMPQTDDDDTLPFQIDDYCKYAMSEECINGIGSEVSTQNWTVDYCQYAFDSTCGWGDKILGDSNILIYFQNTPEL